MSQWSPRVRTFRALHDAFEAALVVLTPAPDFRLSHWLITTTCAALATLAVSRRAGVRRDDVQPA